MTKSYGFLLKIVVTRIHRIYLTKSTLLIHSDMASS